MQMLMRCLKIILVPILCIGCTGVAAENDSEAATPPPKSTHEVVPVSAIQWQPLNPARGDKSPQAGTLWGDRNQAVPTGFLAKFVDGFSSPPHIHNVTYRAVVISGLIHNDDPAAAPMWMPTGSFWTQPKGETHITAAQGPLNLALVEIDEGPYLVLPTSEAFDSGERPVNVDVSNVVWVRVNGGNISDSGPEIAYLWGSLEEGETSGRFVKLPKGFVGGIHAHGSMFKAVVISGRLRYDGRVNQSLEPGSYFGSNGDYVHNIASGDTDVTIYVRTDGDFQVIAQDH